MTRLVWMLLGIGIGIGLAYGASQYHVLRATPGIKFIPRATTGFSDVYVDCRNFTINDWQQRPELVKNIIAAGEQQIMIPQQLQPLINGP
jgi:hypothetical protein